MNEISVLFIEGAPMLQMRECTPDEKKGCSELIVGMTTCPDCNQDVRVVNDHGPWGDSHFNYLENHKVPGSVLCRSSEKMLSDF